MEKQKTIFIIDDDPLVRDSLTNLFEFAAYRVFCYESAAAFLQNPPEAHPACLLLDLRLPKMSGLELQARLVDFQIFLPVVIYTGNADVSITVKALSQGAFTLLQKTASNDELINAVEHAMTSYSESYIQSTRIDYARLQLNRLTPRELEIAELLTDGYTANKVGDMLSLSPRTIETHRTRIFSKLDIQSIATLAKLIVLAEMGGTVEER